MLSEIISWCRCYQTSQRLACIVNALNFYITSLFPNAALDNTFSLSLSLFSSPPPFSDLTVIPLTLTHSLPHSQIAHTDIQTHSVTHEPIWIASELCSLPGAGKQKEEVKRTGGRGGKKRVTVGKREAKKAYRLHWPDDIHRVFSRTSLHVWRSQRDGGKECGECLGSLAPHQGTQEVGQPWRNTWALKRHLLK